MPTDCYRRLLSTQDSTQETLGDAEDALGPSRKVILRSRLDATVSAYTLELGVIVHRQGPATHVYKQ